MGAPIFPRKRVSFAESTCRLASFRLVMSSIVALLTRGCFLRSASRGRHSAVAAKALATASRKLSRDWCWHHAGTWL
eukprot:9501724-Pyramimonas_sp.AAC.1